MVRSFRPGRSCWRLPLYDLIVVSTIRLMRGKSPFVGDTNHFSHRLVARGMSRRTAVLCLYLVSAATAVAAIVLAARPSTFVAVAVFVQTLLILGVVMCWSSIRCRRRKRRIWRDGRFLGLWRQWRVVRAFSHARLGRAWRCPRRWAYERESGIGRNDDIRYPPPL